MFRISLVLSVFAFSLQAWSEGDPAAGKEKSALCMACHGPAGMSVNDLWPNLAGQKEQYLLKQLKAFHSGQRYDPLMTPVAKMLSDKDMENVAKYYAELK